MNMIIAIIVIALLEYMFFSFQVGMARGKYSVEAPSITGPEEFMRYFRVQQNTLEQLIIFIPAILAFSTSAEAISWPGYELASAAGGIWIIGRMVFFIAYIKDPSKRLVGFLMTFLPNVFLLLGTLVCLLLAII